MALHQIQRVRHELRFRTLTVETVERLTPRMVRIGLSSPDLHDFVSASADDHIKLFFPSENGEDEKPHMRDFTPRSFDTARGRLVIDFALHDAGPATQWAADATPGDTLEIGGPRGSSVIPDDFDWYLLIGDETALPAMGRRVEELRPGVPVIAAGLIENADEAQTFETPADLTQIWIVRDAAADDVSLARRALDALDFPAGEGFIWIAAEAGVARALRAYVIDDRGHPREWVKAAGYWKRGHTDAHEPIED